MSYKTEQEEFWSSDFGNDYINRNNSDTLRQSYRHQFQEILQHIARPDSITEFGPNVGNNLDALHQLLPECQLTGIEINPNAANVLKEKGICRVINESVLDYQPDHTADLVFTSGVLIHINPDHLTDFYQKLYETSRQYILLIEYYNPTPVSVDYRGHTGKLFKRDFAGEMLDQFPQLQLIQYGFFYDRDSRYPTGANTNWFLLKKQ